VLLRCVVRAKPAHQVRQGLAHQLAAQPVLPEGLGHNHALRWLKRLAA
jgi:hypothetical protein